MAVSEDRTTLPENNPLPPRRPRRATKRNMLIQKRGYRAPVSSVLAEMSGPLPPAERRLLRTIAQGVDVVAQGTGCVFLLLELSPLDLDRLAAFEAAAEDLETGEDLEGDDDVEDDTSDMCIEDYYDRGLFFANRDGAPRVVMDEAGVTTFPDGRTALWVPVEGGGP